MTIVNKIDPRTGIVDLTRFYRMNRFKDKNTIFKKEKPKKDKDNQDKKDLTIDDYKYLINFAKTMGKTIVEEMKNSMTKCNCTATKITNENNKKQRHNKIEIDNSIADVGIEEKGKIKKGKDSGKITKTRTQTDSRLSVSKSRLKKLKNKKGNIND